MGPTDVPPAGVSTGLGGRISSPVGKVSLVAHLIALLILGAMSLSFLAQPCVGDMICAPAVGVMTTAIALPLAAAMGVWWVARRASALVIVDAIYLTLLIPLSVASLDYEPDPLGLLVLPGLALLLLLGLPGALAEVAKHSIETWIVVVTCGLLAIALTAFAGTPAVVPAIVALVLVIATVGRGWGSTGDPVLHSGPHGDDREE